MRRLLFFTGMTIPFPAVGLELANSLFLSPPMLFGTFYAVLFLLAHGPHRMHLVAAAMLFVFALTAAPRFDPANYFLSIAALTIAIAPLTAPVGDWRQWSSLIGGFVWGVKITLVIVTVEIVAQIFQLTYVIDLLHTVFIQDNTGSFLNYVRPKAGFLEPAHLAIYLGFAYVTLDNVATIGSKWRWLKGGVLLALCLTGSLSGIAVVMVYLVATWSQGASSIFRKKVNRKTLIPLFFSLVLLFVLTTVLRPQVGEFLDQYLVRIVKAIAAIEAGSMVGSEGSRINALFVLPEYWSQSGFVGVLFGTGYANYEAWLIQNYGHLGVWSTFARGQIDSLAIAVILSTGICGLLAYVYFTLRVFSRSGFFGAFGVQAFILIVNFAYGFLVLYLYWYLLFVLSATLRIKQCSARVSAPALPASIGSASSA